MLRNGTLLAKRYSSLVRMASTMKNFVLDPIFGKQMIYSDHIRMLQVLGVNHGQCLCCHYMCTSTTSKKIWFEESSRSRLLEKLETSLKDHEVNEAWGAYRDFKNLYGFPDQPLMSKLITELSYSSDPNCLRRAFNLAILILKEKPGLIRPDLLTNLSLSLARAQMPVAAATVLRLMLEKESLPSVSTLGAIILHMVSTEVGMCLASNILVEICEFCQLFGAKKSTYTKQIKPDTMIFNLVLDACVRFRSSFKGHQIVELMARVAVVADAHTITTIAQIHEMNLQRDDLKKFKDHIEKVLVPSVRYYRQFYESMLSLHFQFSDIDAASELVMDMFKYQEFITNHKDRKALQNPCVVPIGSQYLRTGIKLQILPQLLPTDPVLKVEGKQELIMYKNGKLVLSNRALAKIIMGYKRSGRISELSKLLSNIQNHVTSLQEEFLCSGVFDACIQVGWVETAHDILEDLESVGTPLGPNSYSSLFKAYLERKMSREAEALLKQIRKAGVFRNISDEMVVSTILSENGMSYSSAAIGSCAKSELAESLVREMREEEKEVHVVVNELNSSIYFFMKANMIDDAVKTYRRMQDMKVHPTSSTFFTMVCGYSSLQMYREITHLWGDIKRNIENQSLAVNRDLYELLLFNFLRGGYFERVMEVIGHMKEHGMYADKGMYKKEFLKYHKDLYRNLKAENAKNEVQSNRIEYVQAFRKWVGIH